MRALYWDGHELSINRSYQTPRPPPAAGQPALAHALIKVHLAGICSTDLQIFKGYMSFKGVPGHEFVGSLADGPGELIGRRVVGEINFGCGSARRAGEIQAGIVPIGSVMGILNADGAFAECVSVPLANLHLVPENISDEEAVFTEPLRRGLRNSHSDSNQSRRRGACARRRQVREFCAQVLQLTGAKISGARKTRR